MFLSFSIGKPIGSMYGGNPARSRWPLASSRGSQERAKTKSFEKQHLTHMAYQNLVVLLRIRVVEVDPSKMPPPTIFGFDHSLIGDDTHPIMLGKR